MTANVHTGTAGAKRQNEIDHIKQIASKLKTLMDKVDDKEPRKRIEIVYNVVYSSPVKSHPSVIILDEKIVSSVDELESAVIAGNSENIILLADTLLSMVNERNKQAKVIN